MGSTMYETPVLDDSGIAGYSLFPLLFDAAVYAFSRGDYDGAVQFSELRQVRLFESKRKDVWQFVTGMRGMRPVLRASGS